MARNCPSKNWFGDAPVADAAFLTWLRPVAILRRRSFARRVPARNGVDPSARYERGSGQRPAKAVRECPSRDAALYNEFHALIVRAGRHFRRAQNPRCSECVLYSLIPQHEQREQYGQCDQEQVANIG